MVALRPGTAEFEAAFGAAIDQCGHLRERLLDQDALPPVKAEGLRGVRVH